MSAFAATKSDNSGKDVMPFSIASKSSKNQASPKKELAPEIEERDEEDLTDQKSEKNFAELEAAKHEAKQAKEETVKAKE